MKKLILFLVFFVFSFPYKYFTPIRTQFYTIQKFLNRNRKQIDIGHAHIIRVQTFCPSINGSFFSPHQGKICQSNTCAKIQILFIQFCTFTHAHQFDHKISIFDKFIIKSFFLFPLCVVRVDQTNK